MEIIKTAQVFRNENGTVVFTHTRILYCDDGKTFSATIRSRGVANLQQPNPEQFEDVQQIPFDAYQPIAPSSSLVASSNEDAYVKTPNLTTFHGDQAIATSILEEMKTCELILAKPHPCLVTYYGCILHSGRIVGLCFKKHPQSLMDMVNPRSLNKSRFMDMEELKPNRERAARYLPLIEDGIRHLHSLGRIHNDINPANIMITGDDIPVVIDFGSSRDPGTDLADVGRTHGWFNADVSKAMESNDLDALEEMRIWLTGTSADEYQFKEW
ncbi:hypothetical protein EJ07DRAFT_168354 [Lizonia empirigonia]|nr:hypothetical protein EJ07DRAFT_168354 [Lizonia empirigonia]